MFAHALLLSVICRDHHSYKNVCDKEGSNDLKNDEEDSKVGLDALSRYLVWSLSIDSPVHILDPVNGLTHDHHLIHRSTEVVIVLVITSPYSTVVQTVTFRLNLNLNLVSSQSGYDRTVTVETLAFE